VCRAGEISLRSGVGCAPACRSLLCGDNIVVEVQAAPSGVSITVEWGGGGALPRSIVVRAVQWLPWGAFGGFVGGVWRPPGGGARMAVVAWLCHGGVFTYVGGRSTTVTVSSRSV
jgi:hypothetical protein